MRLRLSLQCSSFTPGLCSAAVTECIAAQEGTVTWTCPGQGQHSWSSAGSEGWHGSGKPASHQQTDSAAAAQRHWAPARTPWVLLFLFPPFSFQPHCPPFALGPSAAFSPHSAQFCRFLLSSQQFEPGPLTCSPSVSAESRSHRSRTRNRHPEKSPAAPGPGPSTVAGQPRELLLSHSSCPTPARSHHCPGP